MTYKTWTNNGIYDLLVQVRGLQRAGAVGTSAMAGAVAGAGAGSEEESPLDIDVGTEAPPPTRLY